MSKFLKYSILVLTLLGLALTSVAHANAPSHDSAECSVCIYQPNTDLQTKSADAIPAESYNFSEQISVWATSFVELQFSCPYFGRAPPLTA